MSNTYKDSGVDKEEGYKTVKKIKTAVSQTHNENVLNTIGSFGAFYALKGYTNPILVSGTDGVGTKIEIALNVKKYDTIGQDCVAMCVNDILCHGAQPLFFLDYLACGKLDSEVAAEIVIGIAKACQKAQCALVGGETAEMPGMYKVGDYDVAGFVVGAVEHQKIIDGANIKEGDVVLALPSSGFHSNGFSLIRKIFTDYYEDWKGRPLYETLLRPTRLYTEVIHELMAHFPLNGIAHITGGGLIENLPRIIPNGLSAHIDTSKIEVPEIMIELERRGNIPLKEMYGTFNMGVGMTLVVDSQFSSEIIDFMHQKSEPIYPIGSLKKGTEKIHLLF